MFHPVQRLCPAMAFAALLTACAGGGGGEGGAEGSEGAGHEAGGDGGGGVASGGFESDGQSLGLVESIVLTPDEAYAGLLNDTEIAVSYDPEGNRFVGRVRNEAATPVCDVRPAVELDDWQLVASAAPDGEAHVIDGLRPFDIAEFEFALASETEFSEWVAVVETFGCASAPSGTGGGGEGSGEHGGGGGEHGGGGEGSGEGGEGSGEGSEGGGEGGEGGEDAPTTPILEATSGTFGQAQYHFLFDTVHMAFRGTVQNPTPQPICGSKTEIHMGIGGMQVVELGPTIPVDLPPGATMKVVMTSPAHMPDTYSVHPEYSTCP